MAKAIGIDIGGSTTKICAFDEEGTLITPLSVRASDPLASIYAAFGKFTDQNAIKLNDIDRVMVTGVGSTFITNHIYGLPTHPVAEFEAVGRGGLYLSGLKEALVVSMGTGTALVRACANGGIEYLGGTGVGGGTLIGLSKKMLGVSTIGHICDLARDGDLANVDLRIGDITKKNISPTLTELSTAANFGKLSDVATPGDTALGIINLVFETIGMMSVFASRSFHLDDIVLTGTLASIPQANDIFPLLSHMFGKRFVIPELAQFGPVIGAAMMKA